MLVLLPYLHSEGLQTSEIYDFIPFIAGEKCADPVGSVPPSLPLLPQNCVDNNMQNLVKLKLQLFPIDDCTRRALERVRTTHKCPIEL